MVFPPANSICDKLDKIYGIIKSKEKKLQLLDDLIISTHQLIRQNVFIPQCAS